ncbi:arginase [Cryobacterium psychrotolerans]|uniref:Arginase n=1 Tax=Cryobacterium psychrotolerans TaxID=386301 RepID=A0A1G9GRM5_9MICO|nr:MULTISPECIES: arginase family protein [Cryobacterium]TFD42125.1 arginase family protein [Cryobacterium sp. TMT1-2-1]TFD86755.1 arginase family protein [Cryobacterium psychrotolerans]SDL03331.1 arginase [Cryobacterium psychrotolerans]
MSPTFVVVPQWQGSISSRAMRLADGAEAIRGDLPESATRTVDVPAEAGDAQDTGIHRFSTLLMVRERMYLTLRSVTDWALTIGGDCGVSLSAVAHAARRHPNDLAVVWLDAHAALHTPETSPSGAFNGMVVRAIAGEGTDGLALAEDSRVPLERVIIAGARDIDPAEADLIAERGIVTVPVEDLGSPDALVAAVRATGAGQVYLHIDLDVLDPSAITGLGDLYPFGLAVETLTGLITALRADFGLAGATIAGFAPASPEDAGDDLPSILRIIGALTR